MGEPDVCCISEPPAPRLGGTGARGGQANESCCIAWGSSLPLAAFSKQWTWMASLPFQQSSKQRLIAECPARTSHLQVPFRPARSFLGTW